MGLAVGAQMGRLCSISQTPDMTLMHLSVGWTKETGLRWGHEMMQQGFGDDLGWKSECPKILLLTTLRF